MSPLQPDRNNPSFNTAARGAYELTEHAKGPYEQSERWMRAAMQNSSDFVMILETDATIRYVSPAVERMLGYRPEDFVGTRVLDYVHPEDLEYMSRSFAEAVKKLGIQPPIEYRVRTADGSWRHVEAIRSNWLDDPDVAGLVANVRDITERKEAERRLEARVRQQAAMAELGRRALEGIEVGSLMKEVADKLAETLEVEYVKVLELCPDGDRLLLRAEVGWREGLVGHATEEVGRGSHSGYTLLAGEPVILDDLSTEERFEAPPLLREHGVTSGVTTLIRGRKGPFGVLAVHSRERRSFTEDDVNFLRAAANMLASAIEHAQAKEDVRRSQARLQAVVDTAFDAVVTGSTDGNICSFNRAAESLFGYSSEEVVGRPLTTLMPEKYRERHRAGLERYLSTGVTRVLGQRRLELAGLRKDGTEFPLELSLAETHEGGVHLFTAIIRDISERQRMEERLRHQALYDSLTGLPNRVLFIDRLGHALQRTQRRAGSRVAVLFLDLDGFKTVNDSLGHEAGDRLLVAVAERLRACVRPEDTIARFGGDDFAVLLENVATKEEPVRVVERITESLRPSPIALEDTEHFVSASMGIAFGDARISHPERLLREADMAMYEAKKEASVYSVFTPQMHERVTGRLLLENDLRRAVEANEFVLHYQPIVRLDGEATPVGVEALLRWKRPSGGLVPPLEFVPLAEETGLIMPIGRWVLREACRQAVEWNRGRCGRNLLSMSVNISARQLRRPEVVGEVEGALHESGLEAGLLTLEITESTLLETVARDGEVLQRLRALGVRIALDDFGTGYSSLSYLKKVHADILKIDRSFVRELSGEARDTTIVRMIVDIAHTLEMEVVGEGVEEADKALLLRGMGCDYAQGFHFSRPLPPEEIEGFLAGA